MSIDTDKLMPQKVHVADDYTHKIAMMDHLMDEFAGESTIIYTTTIKAAKTLQENLSNHGHAAELVGDIEESELTDCDIVIYSDQSKVKISSELMTKLDRNIINFDLPHSVEGYVERLNNHEHNRDTPTLLMLDGYNFNELKSLEKALGEKIDQATIPGLEPLKPFVNLSRGKPKRHSNNNRNSNNTQNKKRSSGPNKNTQGAKNSNNKNQKNKNTKNPKNAKNNNRRKTNKTNDQSQTGDNTQRRQHKGAFGRLNGGTHRKNNKKVGVSRVGTDAPKGGRGWQSDFAEPKERSTDSGKKVKISYNKKRTLSIRKPEEEL